MKFVVALTLLLAQSFAFAQTPPSTLARVTQSGILRVCTPGDYKPFSFQRAPDEFEGLDVDLMGSLATALNAKPQFVKTT
ncbi:hypothetical protein R75465_06658 [Paraburkholderia aspalathi]|nr:hypothetical protein R75465_06658 [Paraburkholderia aspalathi]